MDAVAHLRRLLHYNQWANREVLQALRQVPTPPAPALRLLNHIAGAELLWMARINNQPAPISVWPELSLQECERHLRDSAEAWKRLVDSSSEEALLRKIEYLNSKGEPWSSRIEDIVFHLTMHSAYHRGQIALEMRKAGFTPAYTDFIHAVRQGFLE